MRIAMIGTGYVGLVSGACFAESGNDVICVDLDEEKIRKLEKNEIPIYEPGLGEMVARNARQGRLSFTIDLARAVDRSEVIFIAVGTPPSEDGSSDLHYVLAAARQIARAMKGPKIVVNKSTAPVGTAHRIAGEISSLTSEPFQVVSNPEFLKEGAAIEDFMYPDRVVVGTDSEKASAVMKELYAPFTRTGAPILLMDTASAEMTKYAANAMLASRVSFMNEMANLCERLGADIDRVREGIGSDKRIGRSFLFAGVGYGGSCFPKDIQSLIRIGIEIGYPPVLLQSIEEVNQRQKLTLVRKIDRFYGSALPRRLDGASDEDLEGLGREASRTVSRGAPTPSDRADLSSRTFAVWGLSFKPRTDDMREAPAVAIIRELRARGARIRAYDPEAVATARAALDDEGVEFADNNYAVLEGADALLLITEWNLFRNPDFERMKRSLRHPVIFDGRNQYNPREMAQLGFLYFSIGRSNLDPGPASA